MNLLSRWLFRGDGYQNVVTSVGTQRDANSFNRFVPEQKLDDVTLASLFAQDGIGRRIVARPAEDMCREWVTIEHKRGQEILDVMETLRLKQRMIEAVTLARLFGGALVVAVTERGLDAMATPIAPAEPVVGFKVYDRAQVSFDVDTMSRDPIRVLEGLPELYVISPAWAQSRDASQFKVHESRCCLVPGLFVPDLSRAMNGGWGDSALQPAWNALNRFGASQGYAANIVKEFSQSVLGIKGLTQLLLGGKEDLVIQRLNMLDLSKSILNTMAIDTEGEEYSRNSTSVAGLAEILDRFAEVLSASTNMPITVLLGRSPAGMNSTGKSDLQIYYDFVASEQERVLMPVLEWATPLLFGEEPEAWSVKANPLVQQTQKEILEERKIVADTDKIYLDAGVLSATEVAESRWGSGTWDPETRLIDSTERAEFASQAEPPEIAPPGEAGEGAERGEGAPLNADAAPRSLYVRRDVLNRAEIVAWAKGQGLEVAKPEELHITVTYSNVPVDWFKMGSTYGDEKGNLLIPPGGPRALDIFGAGTVLVLEVASSELAWRNQFMRDMGASTDFEEYRPHVTLCPAPAGLDVASIEPYRGAILLGPEIFEEVRE
ncbi:MAG: hypothetical protein DI556_09740 [Rhodovulum sulfidophilum]|uniref:Anti-CBASS protein Acb1 n=1 Tax=Rhodovulum sulfidophilum TaxID=35806 RepID=A0A2W5Q4V5_RHOSU|nr:MAG: hypothetical protein DI556_09740 [Rhodovulum sulfidophilum]